MPSSGLLILQLLRSLIGMWIRGFKIEDVDLKGPATYIPFPHGQTCGRPFQCAEDKSTSVTRV